MTQARDANETGVDAVRVSQKGAAAIAAPVEVWASQFQARPGSATGSVLVLLQVEAVVETMLAIAAYRYFGGSWLMFLILFAVPDVSMAGYLINPSIGATLYNLGHTYIAPALLAVIAFLAAAPILYLLALIWAAHIGVDRAIGAGLKYKTGFALTHLRARVRKEVR